MKDVICIVGLGYVGLPLAAAFAREGFTTLGYDIAEKRITELKAGHDRTGEVADEILKKYPMEFSTDPAIIEKATVVILAIPTPVDAANKPDLSLVENATHTVGQHLKKGMIIVYESTVYPGVTEDICGPILEQESGLKCGVDFKLGYSPERINPGDKEHTVDRIIKVVAGQDAETLEKLSAVYGSVVKAGIHKAPTIKVAEMAKAIENAQRDINIAFVNEIAILCNHLGIRTKDVFDAARTKWNFLSFLPGLVGGHCIGVDPYYLVEAAQKHGMETHVITAGRQINDGMSCYVGDKITAALLVPKERAKILVMGITFKENVPDMRNSKNLGVYEHLLAVGCHAVAWEPHVEANEAQRFGVTLGTLTDGPFDAIAYLVPHKEFRALDPQKIINALKPKGVFYDLKSLLDPAMFEQAGMTYRSL